MERGREELRSFLVGAFLQQTWGSSLSTPFPIFMKSLARMSSRVGLSAGFFTRMLRIRVIASLGVLTVLGIR